MLSGAEIEILEDSSLEKVEFIFIQRERNFCLGKAIIQEQRGRFNSRR
jgi:hypothetical protein